MLRFVQKESNAGVFERPEGMHPVVYELLCRRGIDSAEAAEQFLHPSEKDLNDPMLLSDMPRAVDMIRSSVDNGDRICVFGDYDADGVCASAVMTILLDKMGAKFDVRIPSRHTDGYGLSMDAVEEIAQEHDLLITVDCGISCLKEIDRAKELGLKCIVTDHHRPGDILPDCIVVDPLLNDYPFPWLCGAGVAFKLTHALLGLRAALETVDIAAIATVADIVSLTGENRAIVRLGLDKINRGARPGVAELIKNAGIEGKRIEAGDLAFKLGPRLNAAGRISSARTSYELLISETEYDAFTSADLLEKHNQKRKSLQNEISAGAMEQLRTLDISAHKILLVRGEDWDHGVIGLAAAHLQGELNMPVIVFAEKDGMLTGSCRSIRGVDIFKTLSSAADLMVKFGGHAQAAGCTIKAEDFDVLWKRLDQYIEENADPECYVPMEEYDLDLPLKYLDEDLIEALSALEPTGCDNTMPVFRAVPQLLDKRACGTDGKHLQLIAADGSKRVKGICFGEGAQAKTLGETADILYVPGLNEWQGRVSVEIQVKAIREPDPQRCVSAIEDVIGVYKCNFLTDVVYNKRYSFKNAVPVITEAELTALMRKNIRGVCVITSNADLCRTLIRTIDAERIDFAAGEFPRKMSALNMITLYPRDLDRLPRSVNTIVFADMPIPEQLPEHARVFALEGHAGTGVEAPDVDEMREVYKTARRLSAQPFRFENACDLDEQLSEASGLSIEKCRLSMLALSDMQLVDVRGDRMIVPPPKKTDPLSSAVWRSVCSLRDA